MVVVEEYFPRLYVTFPKPILCLFFFLLDHIYDDFIPFIGECIPKFGRCVKLGEQSAIAI